MTSAPPQPAADGSTALFSVIIPVFNGAATVARAIRSVLEQDFQDFELIVIDDGSSDNTAAVVQGFGDHRLRYQFQANAGVSRARNHGAELARGQWLAFLDCDDWYYPDRLSRHVALMQAEPTPDFLVGGFESRNERGELTRYSLPATAIGRQLLAKAGGADQASMVGDELGGFVRQQFSDVRALSVPRETFLALGGFPQEFSICEDVYFMIRLAAQSQGAGVALAPLAVYSIHDQGLVRTDTLRSQQQTVLALTTLWRRIGEVRPAIRDGLRELIYEARQNLATVHLRRGERRQALRAVLPLWQEQSPARALRTLLSVARGL